MNKQYLLILLALQLSSVAPSFADDSSNSIMSKIQRSHIDVNIPPAEQFDTLLQRDLNTCFTTMCKANAHVKYDLLRKGATLSNASFPKYYAWVEAFGDDKKLIARGAVRLEAQEQTRFEVTHFVPADAIIKDPAQISSVFPNALCADIEARAKAK